MSLSSHLQELRKKHQELSDEIEALERRPGDHSLEIQKLKKRKLRLKDQIEAKCSEPANA